MAWVPGVEPGISVLETDVLPITPNPYCVDGTGVEPVQATLQAAALPLELFVHKSG